MRILAIETSAPTGSVALWGPDGLLESVALRGPRQHARELAPTVKALLARHGGLVAIEAYAVSIGPGSFTGLRIGVSFIKGLAAAAPRPAVGISTLRVMAAQANAHDPSAGNYLAVMDARRREAFAGLYTSEAVAVDGRLPDGLYPVEALEARLRSLGVRESRPAGSNATQARADLPLGDGLALCAVGDPVLDAVALAWAPAEVAIPLAVTVARLAAPRLEAGEGIDAGRLDPAYHQRSAAEVSLGVHVPDDATLHLQPDRGEVDPTAGRT